MAWMKKEERYRLFEKWKTGKYTLLQLSIEFGVTEATVSNIIGRQLKKSNKK